MATKGDMEAIKTKVFAFTKLTEDFSQAAYRRAGLYGLSAIGVALYQRNVSPSLKINLLEKNAVLRVVDFTNCERV